MGHPTYLKNVVMSEVVINFAACVLNFTFFILCWVLAGFVWHTQLASRKLSIIRQPTLGYLFSIQ